MDAQETPFIDDSVETIINDEDSEPVTVGEENTSDEDNAGSEDDADEDEDTDNQA